MLCVPPAGPVAAPRHPPQQHHLRPTPGDGGRASALPAVHGTASGAGATATDCHRFPSLLQHQNLSLSDFPTHDMSADLVLLAEQRQVEIELKEAYEVR